MNTLAKRFIHIAATLALALAPAASRAADGSQLKPPPGARAGHCDVWGPGVSWLRPRLSGGWEAAKKHNIPVVLHDFPLATASLVIRRSVFARYFDSKSEKLGDDFRGYIFKNQTQIDKSNLRQYVQKFADDNKTPIPFVIDPDGQFKTRILADRQMGTQIGLQHTPTIFVVGNGGPATPAVEVEDRTKLDQIIEDMLQKAPAGAGAKKPATKKAPAKKTAKK
jgi:hypothetical protein